MTGVHRTLEALRAAESVADLVRLAPTHVGSLGLRRCMISRVRGDGWVARSCYVSEDPRLAEAIVEVGSTERRLDRHLVESEVVRRRSAVLVRDAQSDDRVDVGFKRVTSTTSYIAAPIFVAACVVGLVHADTSVDGREVEEFVIGMFAQCVGYVFEHLHHQERLRQIQHQVAAICVTAPDMLDELVGTNGDGLRPPALPALPRPDHLRPVRQTGATRSRPSAVETLTHRELEVLSHLAEGETNARVADRLTVSEATVKAHVKHILRKLGAANRAEAVSRYLRSV